MVKVIVVWLATAKFLNFLDADHDTLWEFPLNFDEPRQFQLEKVGDHCSSFLGDPFLIVNRTIYHVSSKELGIYENLKSHYSSHHFSDVVQVTKTSLDLTKVVCHEYPRISLFHVDAGFIYLSNDHEIFILENKIPFNLKKKLVIADSTWLDLTSSDTHLFLVQEILSPEGDYSCRVHIYELKNFLQIDSLPFTNYYPQKKHDRLLTFSYNKTNDLIYCVWESEINILYYSMYENQKKFILVQNITIEPFLKVPKKKGKKQTIEQFLPQIAFGPQQEVYIRLDDKNNIFVMK